jgi:hypothetical protein
MRAAARRVRLPERVWSIQRMPSSIVNSKSCMSPKWRSSRVALACSCDQAYGEDAHEVVGAMRHAASGDDVLSLRVDQEIDPRFGPAAARVAAEADAGTGVAAAVAQHHALHRHRRADVVIDVVQAPVLARLGRVPGGEYGAHRAADLLADILRKGLAGLALIGRDTGAGEFPQLREVQFALAAAVADAREFARRTGRLASPATTSP